MSLATEIRKTLEKHSLRLCFNVDKKFLAVALAWTLENFRDTRYAAAPSRPIDQTVIHWSSEFSVKVDVHFNNGVLDRSSGENGYTTKAEMTREPSEHAYEQICLRQDPETAGIVASPQRKVQIDNVSDRRYAAPIARSSARS